MHVYLVGLFTLLYESIIVTRLRRLSFLKATTMGTQMTRIKRIHTDLFVGKLRSASIRQIRVICAPIETSAAEPKAPSRSGTN